MARTAQPSWVKRILKILEQAKAKDPDLARFGAYSHQYKLAAPAGEEAIQEIVNELLKKFPKTSRRNAEELVWIQNTFQGQETNRQTICFDRCFCDYIGRLLVSKRRDNVKIKKVFAFVRGHGHK